MKREPLFNIPGVILVILVVLGLVQAVRSFVLTEEQDLELLLWFAFIPTRYDSTVLPAGQFPGGVGAQVWSFATYALLHGSWTHLAVNAIWLLPFGSAVARRFGPMRFIAFFTTTAVAGALAHLIAHAGETNPVVGASAAISGAMAAAMRFAFQRGGPVSFWRQDDEAAYRVRALRLAEVFRDTRVLAFIVVWFGINLVFGAGHSPLSDQPVAWEAHIGGFFGGLLLFSLFDPRADSAGRPDIGR